RTREEPDVRRPDRQIRTPLSRAGEVSFGAEYVSPQRLEIVSIFLDRSLARQHGHGIHPADPDEARLERIDRSGESRRGFAEREVDEDLRHVQTGACEEMNRREEAPDVDFGRTELP